MRLQKIQSTYPTHGLEGVEKHYNSSFVPHFTTAPAYQRAQELYQLSKTMMRTDFLLVSFVREKLLKISAHHLAEIVPTQKLWLQSLFQHGKEEEEERLERLFCCIFSEISLIIYTSENISSIVNNSYQLSQKKEIDLQFFWLHTRNNMVSLTNEWLPVQRAFLSNKIGLVYRDLLNETYTKFNDNRYCTSETELQHEMFHFFGFAIASSKKIMHRKMKQSYSRSSIFQDMYKLCLNMLETGSMPEVFDKEYKDTSMTNGATCIENEFTNVDDLKTCNWSSMFNEKEEDSNYNNPDTFVNRTRGYKEIKNQIKGDTHRGENSVESEEEDASGFSFAQEREPLMFSLLDLGGLSRPAVHTHAFGIELLKMIKVEFSKKLCAESIKNMYQKLLLDENLDILWKPITEMVPGVNKEACRTVKKC
jgi:hypothetical protein